MKLHLSILFLCGMAIMPLTAAALTINYTADVAPDDASLQDVFSTVKTIGEAWSVSGGELFITCDNDNGDFDEIWFGNGNPGNDPVPWSLASNSEGNSLSVRAKAESGYMWFLAMDDGDYSASIHIANVNSEIWAGTDGTAVQYAVDSSVYHTYSIAMQNGEVTYKVDDDVVYSGPAGASFGDPPLTVGTSSFAGYADGTLVIDDVTVTTVIPEPGSLVLLVLGVASLVCGSRGRRD